MTIKELILKLREYEPDTEVFVAAGSKPEGWVPERFEYDTNELHKKEATLIIRGNL
jgi:hypothetical protein